MKEIQLNHSRPCKNMGKYVALVDDEDFEYLNQWKWCVAKSANSFYAVRTISIDGKRRHLGMHNAVLKGKGIDHVDNNGLNNQKSNLRFCTVSENAMNNRKQENTSSVYKGVTFEKRVKKWKATIQINGKSFYLGHFTSEVEAAKAYNAKAIALFCEFANLNIID